LIEVMVLIRESGSADAPLGGSDPRKDGFALGY
jgi:hypothetical protein